MPVDGSKMVMCDMCNKEFKAAGIGHHQKACARQARRNQEDAMLLEDLKQGI